VQKIGLKNYLQKINMSIRNHIEAADDALRLAIIEALEKKQDEQLDTLFEALGKVRELILTTPIRFTDNTSEYYRNNAEYNFNLESDINLETGGYKVPADVITFPTDYTGDDDLISDNISIGLTNNDDTIVINTKSERNGGDLDNLDGPT
tara:strand:- start:704 stop:1153 length:450 start_codon:yes stop_codon:yes gene_type:complete